MTQIHTKLNKSFIKFSLLFVAITVPVFASSASARAESINSRALNATFESPRTGSPDIAKFPKWTRILSSYSPESQLKTATCGDNNAEHCLSFKWKQSMAELKGKDWSEVLGSVNKFVNSVPYVEDMANFNRDDLWQTPKEFFAHNGDCEDYAITKYFTLKLMGFPKENMRIMVLNDNNLGLIHAVLVVKLESKTLILDNQLPEVAEAKSLNHYEPIFSINESGWWRHQVTTASLSN